MKATPTPATPTGPRLLSRAAARRLYRNALGADDVTGVLTLGTGPATTYLAVTVGPATGALLAVAPAGTRVVSTYLVIAPVGATPNAVAAGVRYALRRAAPATLTALGPLGRYVPGR